MSIKHKKAPPNPFGEATTKIRSRNSKTVTTEIYSGKDTDFLYPLSFRKSQTKHHLKVGHQTSFRRLPGAFLLLLISFFIVDFIGGYYNSFIALDFFGLPVSCLFSFASFFPRFSPCFSVGCV